MPHAIRPIICTGQMRAGTSWLYDCLKGRPNIWCPPVKEMRLLLAIQELGGLSCAERFDESVSARGAPIDLVSWWRDVTWRPYLRAMTEQATVWLNGEFPTDAAVELEFWLNYLGQPLSVDLYDRLSKLAPTRSMLDITPDYVGLTSNTLRSIASQMPVTKFIVMLRCHEYRLRSQICMDVASGAEIGDNINSGYVRDYLESPYSLAQINVHRHIKKMIECFPANDIFVTFYEDLRDRPRELCDRLAEFCETFIQDSVPGVVNAHTKIEIPNWLVSYIEAAARPVSDHLAQLVGGHALTWRDDGPSFSCLASGTVAEIQARQSNGEDMRSAALNASPNAVALTPLRRAV